MLCQIYVVSWDNTLERQAKKERQEKKEIKKYRNFNPWWYTFIKNGCPFVGNTLHWSKELYPCINGQNWSPDVYQHGNKHTALNESLNFQQMTELSEVYLREPNRNEFYWIQFYKQCQDTDKTKTYFTVGINVLVRQNLCYTAKQFLHGNNIFLITTIITSVIVFRIFILVVSRLQAHQI